MSLGRSHLAGRYKRSGEEGGLKGTWSQGDQVLTGRSAGGTFIVAVCFQPWEGFPCQPAAQGQKEEVALLTQRADPPGVPQ